MTIIHRARSQDGLTMIIALCVMLVTSLLLTGAFMAVNGDINVSHEDTIQKQAYYAALAGVQEYEAQLQANPNYWETCASPANIIPEKSNERYEIKLLVASSAGALKECSTTKPFESMIEKTGPQANTFRIESTGCAGLSELKNCNEGQSRANMATRKIVATFQVTGFLNFVYFTNREDEDPGLYNPPKAWKCQEPHGVRSEECQKITFVSGDAVKGPMHSNDAANVCGSPTFGRAAHNPLDAVEINGGTYPGGGCEGATYNTASKKFTKGLELIPPKGDTSLGIYVEKEDQFTGVTHLVLEGGKNQITVTNAGFNAGKPTPIPWPTNGLVWIKSTGEEEEAEACTYKYNPLNSDNAKEVTEETNCGNVYVSGTYSNSLTIGAANDLIINGSICPTTVNCKEVQVPTGTATLGLIASNYVRIYHPLTTPTCEGGSKNKEPGSLVNPLIYAAILSTDHSFVVDNYNCGNKLEELHVFGAIAQDYRGIVGTGGGGGTGYLKDYNYDDRLAVDEPPYFLSPLNAGWKIARVTAPTGG